MAYYMENCLSVFKELWHWIHHASWKTNLMLAQFISSDLLSELISLLLLWNSFQLSSFYLCEGSVYISFKSMTQRMVLFCSFSLIGMKLLRNHLVDSSSISATTYSKVSVSATIKVAEQFNTSQTWQWDRHQPKVIGVEELCKVNRSINIWCVVGVQLLFTSHCLIV